jgi:formylglycine-generating enzyme
MNRIFLLLFLFCAICVISPLPARAFVTMAWSPVGNPGNANDPADGDDGTLGIQNFGAVPYAYNIGTYDVTASQYVEFLNTKDPTGDNMLGLYNTNMSLAGLGVINFNNGNSNGSKYSVISGSGNHPVNWVSWYDAIRFANWLNNGQGSGDTESGAYTLGTLGAGSTPVTPPLTHNPGSKIWLPTENEWYKAAYYNPATSSYFLYPTSSNLAPTASTPTAAANHANYAMVGLFTDVGAYAGTTSPYGAFDMGGNVYQWNEALIGGSLRGLRGGSRLSISYSLQSVHRDSSNGPTGVYDLVGFRLASVTSVPEPPTYVLFVSMLFGFAILRNTKQSA